MKNTIKTRTVPGGKRRGTFFLVLIAAGLCGVGGPAMAAPQTNSIPWNDTFEQYTNGTPLIDGTNGWYGSSGDIIVQTNTVRSGTNAAMIPVDCTLSNRFRGATSTNVWLQMDVRVALYDGQNSPAVDTNSSAMFYVYSNGLFVVHNGPASPSPTNSANWVTLTNTITGEGAATVTNGQWVRVNIHQDFARTNWTLFAGNVLLTNNIGFIKTSITNLNGFDLYSGSSTTYLDNVYVMATNPPDLAANGGNWLPGLAVSSNGFTNMVFKDRSTTSTLEVWRAGGYYTLGFTAATNIGWLSATPTTGTSAGAYQPVSLLCAATGLANGTYTGQVTVTGADTTFGFTASNSPATVTVVMNIMELMVSPGGLTNSVMVGRTPSAQNFNVVNAGAGSFAYTVTTNAPWVIASSNTGTLGPYSTNTIAVTYASTAGWAPGASNTTITIASTAGGGATQTVSILLNVMELEVNPAGLTNSVMVGRTPSAQSLDLVNAGAGSFAYTVTTNAPWVIASSNAGTLGPYSTNTIAVTYASTAGWTPGASNAAITIASSDGGGVTQIVGVLMNVMELQMAPTGLTNTVMLGRTPSAQTFNIWNAGAGSFAYTVATNAPWVSPSSNNGTLGANATNLITLTYGSTAGWSPGTSNATVTVVSTDGGGATQTLTVVMYTMDLVANPTGLTNVVMVGYTPSTQSFTIANPGTAPLQYALATNAPWVTCLDPAGGALAAPGTNTITVSYAQATGWSPGTSNAMITVISTNDGGATQTVAIVMTVVELLPPAGVTATKGTHSDKVRVTWSAVATATGYQVWRNTANDTSTAASQGTTAALLFDDTTAVQEVTYYYWVKSTNALGVSAFSASDTGYRSLGAPPAPTGVTASDGTYADKVAVTWQASASATSYEVWRNTASDSNTASKISGSGLVDTSYNDTSAAGGIRYYYWVKARGSNDTSSAFSASDTGWRALAPSGITASSGLRREIRVAWDESSGATSYELRRNVTADLESATLLISGLNTTYRDQDVEPGVIYFYWVKAISALTTTVNGPATGWCSGRKWDFGGDGRADAWYYNEGSGRWYVVPASNVVHTTVFGGPGMVAVPDDYDGDGKADPAVYEESSGNWMVMLSGSGYAIISVPGFGGTGYKATPGDYDGDGKADPAVYKETIGAWQVMLSGNGYAIISASGFGTPGYKAASADYDGDGKTDPTVYQESAGNWLLMLSDSHYVIQHAQFGAPGYAPVPGEYHGLGYAEIAVYHEASGYWYIRTALGDYEAVHFGQSGYAPISADYDGDGYDDVAVFYRDRYNALWYLQKSTEGFQTISGRDRRPWL